LEILDFRLLIEDCFIQKSSISHHQSPLWRFHGCRGTQKTHETVWFAVIRLVEALPKSRTAGMIGYQLLRSGTSVGSNYRSACRGRSRPDFTSKVGIAIEEADESLYWMEMLIESGIVPDERLNSLMQEANELIAIFTASVKTARSNSSRKPLK
jgi:four helix bundle protein